MIAVVYALISMLCSALAKILSRHVMKRGACPIAALSFYCLMGAAIIVCIFPIPSLFEIDGITALILVGNCLIWTFGSWYEIKAYQVLEASAAELFGTLRLVIIAVAGILLFGEHLGISGFVGVMLVLASILIQLERSNELSIKGSRSMLISTLFVSAAIILDKHLTQRVDVGLIALSAFLLPGIFYAVAGFKKVNNYPALIMQTRGLYLLFPILAVARYHFGLKAFAAGELTTTTIILQTCVAAVFLFEVCILKIHEKLIQRSCAAALCVAGAILVCLG